MAKLLSIALRVIIVYTYLLIVVRLSGKRTIKEGTPLDLMVALIISDMPDDVIWGEVPLAQGFVAISSVMLAHLLLVYLGFRIPRLDRLLGMTPTRLIRETKLEPRNLALQHINDQQLTAMLRAHQVDRIAEVEQGMLEPSGQLSVIRREGFKPAQKRDRGALEKMVK